jgi:hypothetical protein
MTSFKELIPQHAGGLLCDIPIVLAVPFTRDPGHKSRKGLALRFHRKRIAMEAARIAHQPP